MRVPANAPAPLRGALLVRRSGLPLAVGSISAATTTRPSARSLQNSFAEIYVIAPDFSPCGDRLTFGSNRDGGDVDIWAMSVDGSSAVNLTSGRTTTNDRWSSWSPHGTKIAFWSGLGNGLGIDAEIYTLTIADGNLVNLTQNQSGEAQPDWGPARAAGKDDAAVQSAPCDTLT